MEDKFGVSAAAPVAAVAAAAPAAGEAQEEKEQTEFDVVLNKPGDKKIQVIKVRVASKGRTPSEKFCVADNRVIRVKGLLQESGVVKIKLVRVKHNIFLGVPL